MKGGAGSNAGDSVGAAGGAARAAGEENGNTSGGNRNAGDPPPPGSRQPSDDGNRNPRISGRHWRIQELQYAKPVRIKELKKFGGKPGEDFDTWWVLVQVYKQDQPETFPKDERTIDWIGSLMDRYAAPWPIQWLKGTLNGIYPNLMTGYTQALKLRFKDIEAKDEAYANLDEVRYDGCIWDMLNQIQKHNNDAQVSGEVLKKLILDWLPKKFLERMHMVDLTGRSDNNIIHTITKAGRTAAKWDVAKKNSILRKSVTETRNEKPQYKEWFE